MKRLFFIFLALAVLIGDQVSKSWITRTYPPQIPEPVWAPVLYILRTTNDGVAWSLFRGHTGFFSFIAVAFSIGVVVVGWNAMHRSAALSVAMGLLVGGSLGNLIDRIRLHYVVDFIDVHIGHWYEWPTFNVADSAITTGMILLAAYFWVIEKQMQASLSPDLPGSQNGTASLQSVGDIDSVQVESSSQNERPATGF